MGNNLGMNNAQQTPVSQPGAQFDFSSIMGQQQNAIKSQESGEQVVPASNNPMGLGGQMNVSQGVNPQQLLANQNNQGGNNPNQMQAVYQLSEQKIAAAAQDAGLSSRAEDNTRNMLRQFLGALGYTTINVNFPNP